VTQADIHCRLAGRLAATLPDKLYLNKYQHDDDLPGKRMFYA